MKTNLKTAIANGEVIRLIAPVNPYREGTIAFRRFEAYRDGAPVAEVVKAKGVDLPGFRWDINTDLIEVVAPARKAKTSH